MTQLPLTVIGGYLGAGKTTLINHLLTGDHGKRLMIMVNDFGSVNIDAALLANASDDTLELTNGCVCCTMGADLFMAVGDVLDRAEWPDHLIIEASGIADPAKIAQVAETDPDLSYAGILTVVDAENIDALLADPQIAPQIQDQIRVADLIYVSKLPPSSDLRARLRNLTSAPMLSDQSDVPPLLWEMSGVVPDVSQGHTHFTRWATSQAHLKDRDALIMALRARPAALYRVKGFATLQDGIWLVQCVGRSVSVTAATDAQNTTLVGIAPAGAVSTDEIDAWWRNAQSH